MAMATPNSSMDFTSALFAVCKIKEVAGRRMATTLASAMARRCSRSAWMRCSADTALTSAASKAPPRGVISSAWTFAPSPSALARSSMERHSSMVKALFSQKQSQNSARPSAATWGSIWSRIIAIYSSRAFLYSGGKACAPMKVRTTSTGCLVPASRRTQSCFSSVSRLSP